MIKYVRIVLSAIPHLITRYPKILKMRKHKEKYDLHTRYSISQKLIRQVNKSSFHCEFIVKGRENISSQQTIYYGNHTANFDPIALLTIMPYPVCFLAKQEVLKMPIIGPIADLIGSRFIDRMDLRSEIKVFREIDNDLQEYPELSYCVFPEGTRSKRPDFEMLPFHAGSFKIATRRELPIVPIAFYMTDRVLYQKYHYKKYPIQITFLKPLYPQDYEHMTSQEIADYVQNEIRKEVENMRKLDLEYVKKLNHFSDKKAQKVLLLPNTSN